MRALIFICTICTAALIAAAGFTGCSGGGGGGSAFSAPTKAPSPVPTATQPPNPAAPNIYASNALGNSITVYPLTSTGNEVPIRDITGPNTGLNFPQQGFLDSTGTFYVVNKGTTANPVSSVVVFAPGANGNVPPIESFTGPFGAAQGLTVDSSGNIYVGDQFTHAVYVFAKGASGVATPVRTISGNSTLIALPEALAIGPSGNLYVSDSTNGILIFPLTANGNVAPLATISGSNTGLANAGPEGVAFDAAGNLYVCTVATSHVYEYAAGATGNIAPIRDISGSATDLATLNGLAIDSVGNIYIGHGPSSGPGYAVLVFGPTANGNVPPSQLINGSNTLLNGPFYVTI